MDRLKKAREEIERLFEYKVNLKLWVKVKKDWRDSDILMKNYGYKDGNTDIGRSMRGGFKHTYTKTKNAVFSRVSAACRGRHSDDFVGKSCSFTTRNYDVGRT